LLQSFFVLLGTREKFAKGFGLPPLTSPLKKKTRFVAFQKKKASLFLALSTSLSHSLEL